MAKKSPDSWERQNTANPNRTENFPSAEVLDLYINGPFIFCRITRNERSKAKSPIVTTARIGNSLLRIAIADGSAEHRFVSLNVKVEIRVNFVY